ncbi:MAG: hypothetical protein JJ974_10100 [Phycisphaerales bacterium]|nr:hypothetical protein [Phycisphaerales bacterium]
MKTPSNRFALLAVPVLLTATLIASCATTHSSAEPNGQSKDQPTPEFVHETTDQYTTKSIEGFRIRISKAALDHPESTNPALDLLRRQLKQTINQTPESTHETLRKTTFWIEHNNPQFPCACYHPSAVWLVGNGYNTDKERSIEIANPTNFVNWVNTGQPSMILHELAHAYQHATLGYNNPLVTKPYEQAKASGTYDQVDHISGNPRNHYAMENEVEYFAELTEAYFGFNDFYPFSRDQLKAHDPDGYRMIQVAWGLRDQQN